MNFRNYDPVLGRMNAVDPLAGKYASLTPYNYLQGEGPGEIELASGV